MILSNAASMARTLMNQHGLTDWTFQWNRRKRALGCCKYGPQIIELSEYFVKINSESEIRDTILHEIAHALAGREAGHGWRWRSICRQIGARPQTCVRESQVNVPSANYHGSCPACGTVYKRYRLSKRLKTSNSHCGACKTPQPLIWKKVQ